MADFNGDGYADLLVTNGGNRFNPSQVFLNDGTGQFAETPQALPFEATTRPAIGDVDNDGDLDIVYGGAGIYTNAEQGDGAVLVNDGTGHFSVHQSSFGPADTSAITFGDVDGDGAIDALVTSASGLTIWKNDGLGGFQFQNSVAAGSVGANTLMDVDEDGDLDVVYSDSNAVRTMVNNGQGQFSAQGTPLSTSGYVFYFAGSDLLGDLNASPTIRENTTAVTTIAAVDPDAGDVVTYSIAGGDDAAKFQIDSQTGVLSFIAAPDFESPTDANGDNVYQLVVQATDNGGADASQTISVTVRDVSERSVIFGTEAGEAIDGTPGDDEINALGGNDTINGLAGADTIYAGAGDDTAWGQAGNDVIDGGDGNDNLYGDEGDDTLLGGDGSDGLIGGDGNDTLVGGLGDDYLAGQRGNNTIDAGGGNDLISSGLGSDPSGIGAFIDVIDGGDGIDKVAIFRLGETADYTLDISNPSSVFQFSAGGSITNVERATVYAGNGNNTLIGGDYQDHLEGGAGNDTLIGNGGDDVLYGYGGNNTLRGGSGNDNLLSQGTDVVDGGDGIDLAQIWRPTFTGDLVLSIETPSEEQVLGDGSTIVNIERLALEGGIGNDTVRGGQFDDFLRGWEGNDTFYGNGGSDVLAGGIGNDQLFDGVDNDKDYFVGDEGDDLIESSGGANDIDGGTGIDTLNLLRVRQVYSEP